MVEAPEGSKEFLALVDSLTSISSKHEIIETPKGRVYNFYNPNGMELAPFLDSEHLPSITNFTTVIFSEGFAGLRGVRESFDVRSPVRVAKGDMNNLATMTLVAASLSNYNIDDPVARKERTKYRKSAAVELDRITQQYGIGKNVIEVGVRRAGSNILDTVRETSPETDVPRVDVDAKRLRFTGLPDLLGAGVVISNEAASLMKGKDVRLKEVIVAAGSTEVVIASELRNRKVDVASLSCDAVIVCPAGAQFANMFRSAIGIQGEEATSFYGGHLSDIWYVVWDRSDPLLAMLAAEGYRIEELVGGYVGGDGGDLTSNTDPIST